MTTTDGIDLEAQGFEGFVPFSGLAAGFVRREPGTYVVIRPVMSPPRFIDVSPAGKFKRKDPSVTITALEEKWVNGAQILYIGMAGAGSMGTRGLHKRLDEFKRFGAGEPVGHWGGRYIWQLTDHWELLVAWHPTGQGNPPVEETWLMTDFKGVHGRLPFANLRH